MAQETQAQGQAAFALTKALLTYLIKGNALTNQGAGVLILEATALIKGADGEEARNVLLELAGQYGAKALNAAKRKRR